MRHRPSCLVPAIALLASLALRPVVAAESGGLTAKRNVVIFEDDRYYSAFPSIVARPDGELLVAFRRAPNRVRLGEGGNSHTDPNSNLVLTRSADHGRTWSTPTLIHAYDFGGSQDPCMVQLGDGSLVCTSYGWARLAPDAAAKVAGAFRHGNFVFLGGYLVRSEDAGRSWQGPILPPPIPGARTRTIFGGEVPAYNRGAMTEARDGRLHWITASETPGAAPGHTELHHLVSADKGLTWTHQGLVAADPKIQFNETSLVETAKGDLVAFVRSEGFNDHTVTVRSTDGGKTWGAWQDTGFQGHPHHALRLPDGRIVLVYGYRHRPFGVRARLLDPECANPASAAEVVLRDDGGDGDLGYPWAALTGGGEVLCVYYFNKGGVRTIEGTFIGVE